MSALQSAELVPPRTGSRGDGFQRLLQRKAVSSLIDGLAVFSKAPTSDFTIITGALCSGKTSIGSLLKSAAAQDGVPFRVPTVSCGWDGKNALLGGLDELQSAVSGPKPFADCSAVADELGESSPDGYAVRSADGSEDLLYFIDDIDRLHDVHIRRVLSLVRRARNAASRVSVVGTARAVPHAILTADDIRVVSHASSANVHLDEPLDVLALELEPLSLEETRTLLRQGSAEGLSEVDVACIHIAAGGNVLLIDEASRDMGFRELVKASTLEHAVAQHLLETAGAHRVRLLSESERLALRLVSRGPGVCAGVVAGVLGISDVDAENMLKRLEEARLARSVSGGGEYTLHDASVSMCLEVGSSPDERRREHVRIADVIISCGASEDSSARALAAWHLGEAGEHVRAAEHACAALPSAVERAQCVVVDELINLVERAALREVSDGAGMAASLVESADAAWRSGKAPIAVRLSAIGLRMLRSNHVAQDELEIALLWNRGRAEALSGSVDRAAGTLREAQMMSFAQQSDEWQARLLISWCIVHQMRGEFERILGAGTRALKIAEAVGDKELVGSACLAIGNAYHALCSWDEARVWYEKSVRAAEVVGDRRGVIVHEFDVALADFSMGNWDLAEPRLARLVESSTELGHAYILELAQNLTGLLWLGRGDLAAARHHFQIALVSSRECGDEWGLALSYSNQGALERESGRPRLAIRLFERAEHMMDRVGSRDDLPELLRRRAEAHLDLGQTDEAVRLADRGLALVRGFSNPLEEWGCTRVLSQVAAARGETTRAVELAQDAATGLGSIGSKFEEGLALRQLAEAQRLAGLQTEATRSARESLSIFSELSARREAKRTQDLLSSLDEPAVAASAARTLEPGRLASLCRSSTMLASARAVAAVARETADLAASEIPVDVAVVFANAGHETESALSDLCSAAGREDVTDEARRLCESSRDESDGTVLLGKSGDEALPESAGELGVRSALVVPLNARERTFGHIYLDYRERDAEFTDDDVRFVEALAAQAATALENIELRSKLEDEIETLRWEVDGRYSFSNIIGRSVEMQKVFSLLERVSSSSATVLVEGESGTGKELVARAVHHNSPRKNERFVPQNCAALPEQLLESELFGHVRGAFTGALREKRGLFEAADGGTFFLDEIADMPPSLQVKLLRVLQDGEIRRVGATDSISVDVRIIAATNKSLEDEVKAGRFRQDLFYRLNVVRIEMPPLRVRRDDIPLLAQHFLDTAVAESGKDIGGFTDGAMQKLVNYDWPGNVRELENEMQRAVALARGEEAISEADLSERIRSCEVTVQAPKHGAGLDLKGMVEDIERRVILQMLEEYHWNKSKTAEALGLSRQGLLKKIARLKLQRREE